MTGRTVVLDCRWLGIGGPGRTTELVLRGLAADPGPDRWVLWGREPLIAPWAWPGAEVRPIEGDPRLLLGQRHAFEVPRGDFHVFMHQQRPLRSLPAATLVYDTIPLRHGSGGATVALKRAFMRRVARTSRVVLTISEHSEATIVRDLGVSADRVRILRFPFDDALADRVRRARERVAPMDAALFVGGFLPHKNLPRLLDAFGRTAFRREGGRLVLVAATGAQADRFLRGLDPGRREFVDVRHSCPQEELDELYAACRFLVQPSLEEGFGLPAWEALCAGLPVCVSDGGALPEVTRGFAEPFPASSVPAMTAALDACAARARAFDHDQAAAQSAALRSQAPTVADFGAQLTAALAAGALTAR